MRIMFSCALFLLFILQLAYSSSCVSSGARAASLLATKDWTGPQACYGTNKKFIHVFFVDLPSADLVTRVHVDQVGYPIVGNTSLCVDGGSSIVFFLNDNDQNVLQTSGNVLMLINGNIVQCVSKAQLTSYPAIVGEVYSDTSYPGTDMASASPTAYAECESPNKEVSIHFEVEEPSQVGWGIYQVQSSVSIKPELLRQSANVAQVDYVICLSPNDYYVTAFSYGTESFQGNWSIRVNSEQVYAKDDVEFRDAYLLAINSTEASVLGSEDLPNCGEGERSFSLAISGDNLGETSWSLVKVDGEESKTIFDQVSSSASTCLPSGKYYWDITDSGGDGLENGSFMVQVDGAVIRSGSVFGVSDSVQFSL